MAFSRTAGRASSTSANSASFGAQSSAASVVTHQSSVHVFRSGCSIRRRTARA